MKTWDVQVCLFVSISLFVLAPTVTFAHEGIDQSAHHSENISTTTIKEMQSLTSELLTPSVAKPGNTTSAQGAQPLSQLEIAQKRGKMMEELAQKNPQVFLQNVMSATARAQLPVAARGVVEQQKTIVGTAEVLHADDFNDPTKSKFDYSVRVGNKKLDFYPVGTQPALTSGSKVTINGYQVGNSIVAAGGDGGVEVTYEPVPDATGAQRVLFILVTANGEAQTPPPQQLKDTIFNGAFQKFYQEQSYGKISFTGDVTDWISVSPYSGGDACGAVELDTAQISKYLLSKKVNLSHYDHVVFVVNGASGGCAFVGRNDREFNNKNFNFSIGWVGYPDSPWDKENMTGFEFVLAHEMGHQLGVMHANAWRCAGPSLDANCSHEEYGNYFDTMGHGNQSAHFNAFYKDLLGWLDPSQKVRVSKGGLYAISPLQTAGGVKAAIITNPSAPSMPPLYVEYRRPIGFDSNLDSSSVGLFLNQVIDRGYKPYPHLLDANYYYDQNYMVPKDYDTRSTPVLRMPGQQSGNGLFSWPTSGIRMQAQSSFPESMAFDLQMTPALCNRKDVGLSNVYFSEKVQQGTDGYMQLMVTNMDSFACSPRTITPYASISPRGDVYLSTYPDVPFDLAPGESAYVTVNLHSTPRTTSGTYKLFLHLFSGDGTKQSTLREVSVSRSVDILKSAHIDTVSPESGAAGTRVTLSGSDFFPESTVFIYDPWSGLGVGLPGQRATSNSVLSFVFPEKMQTYDVERDEIRMVPTPPDRQYSFYLEKTENGEYDGMYSNTAYFTVTAPCSVTLGSGQTLTPGQRLTSCNNEYSLRFQTDSNLVLYRGSTALWASNTVGKGATRLAMQTDGNLVIYAGSKAIWSLLSYTGGRMGAGQYLELKDNGILAVYDTKGNIRWDRTMPRKVTATSTSVATTSAPVNTSLSSPIPVIVTAPLSVSTTTLSAASTPTSCTTSKLIPGQSLAPGHSLTSCNGAYTATFDTSGNLSLGNWSSNTAGLGATILTMQTDGNLVMYTARRASVWSLLSYQGGKMGVGQYLELKDDGTLAVYSSSGAVRWDTTMPRKATGSLAFTPCTPGLGKSIQDTANAAICDQTISWTTLSATNAKVIITGSSPYTTTAFPTGYTAGTGANGSAAFWVTTGTYTATLIDGATTLDTKQLTITKPSALRVPSSLSQMAGVLESLRSILWGLR